MLNTFCIRINLFKTHYYGVIHFSPCITHSNAFLMRIIQLSCSEILYLGMTWLHPLVCHPLRMWIGRETADVTTDNSFLAQITFNEATVKSDFLMPKWHYWNPFARIFLWEKLGEGKQDISRRFLTVIWLCWFLLI